LYAYKKNDDRGGFPPVKSLHLPRNQNDKPPEKAHANANNDQVHQKIVSHILKI
jgi:hypothetical protein